MYNLQIEAKQIEECIIDVKLCPRSNNSEKFLKHLSKKFYLLFLQAYLSLIAASNSNKQNALSKTVYR